MNYVGIEKVNYKESEGLRGKLKNMKKMQIIYQRSANATPVHMGIQNVLYASISCNLLCQANDCKVVCESANPSSYLVVSATGRKKTPLIKATFTSVFSFLFWLGITDF